jgi:hypothetical protein
MLVSRNRDGYPLALAAVTHRLCYAVSTLVSIRTPWLTS